MPRRPLVGAPAARCRGVLTQPAGSLFVASVFSDFSTTFPCTRFSEAGNGLSVLSVCSCSIAARPTKKRHSGAAAPLPLFPPPSLPVSPLLVSESPGLPLSPLRFSPPWPTLLLDTVSEIVYSRRRFQPTSPGCASSPVLSLAAPVGHQRSFRAHAAHTAMFLVRHSAFVFPAVSMSNPAKTPANSHIPRKRRDMVHCTFKNSFVFSHFSHPKPESRQKIQNTSLTFLPATAPPSLPAVVGRGGAMFRNQIAIASNDVLTSARLVRTKRNQKRGNSPMNQTIRLLKALSPRGLQQTVASADSEFPRRIRDFNYFRKNPADAR